MSSYNYIVTEPQSNGVLLIKLNRPEARNALTTSLLTELAAELDAASLNSEIRAVVLYGNDSVFAAGADLKEMAKLDVVGVLQDVRPKIWKRIYDFKKPMIAAVNGYCLGGGCELAMHADIIIAGETAEFGQPEINLGIIPGAGGTQRLIRTVGKSLAMKMCLSGEFINADVAVASGLAAEKTADDQTLTRALELATRIAKKAPLAVQQAKEVLLKAFETDLEAGLHYERKAFTVLAATEDRDEGIAAFLEKRKPQYKGR